MTPAGAIQERRVWFSGTRGWGVGAALVLFIAYATDVPTIHLAGNDDVIVYGQPWLNVLRAAAFLLLGAATIGLGAYLATCEPSLPPSRRIITPRVLSWMAAFVVAALVVWFRDPIVNFIAGPPGPNIVPLHSSAPWHGLAHAPTPDGLKLFAILFGFFGGSLSTLTAGGRGPLANFGASLVMGVAWAGGWLLAAIVLPLLSYLAIVSVEAAPILIHVALLVPGFLAGIIAASIALPLQRRLDGSS
jgi:hypothetical protein